jgi:hypothetical protein
MSMVKEPIGIDSKETIPPAIVAWRAGASKRVVVPAARLGNRFLGSLKGLQIRALIVSLLLPTDQLHLYMEIYLDKKFG